MDKQTILNGLKRKQRNIQNEINKKRRSANRLNAQIDRLIEQEIEKARKRAEEEARLKAEEEARMRAEAEARVRAAEEARLKAEQIINRANEDANAIIERAKAESDIIRADIAKIGKNEYNLQGKVKVLIGGKVHERKLSRRNSCTDGKVRMREDMRVVTIPIFSRILKGEFFYEQQD